MLRRSTPRCIACYITCTVRRERPWVRHGRARVGGTRSRHSCTGTCAVPAQEEDPSASGPVAVAPARVAPVSVNGSFGNAGGTDGALRESLLEKGNLSKSGSNRPLITVLHEAIHPSPAWFRKHVCSDVQLAWILGGAGVCLGVTSLALQAYSAAQPPPSGRTFFSWRG